MLAEICLKEQGLTTNDYTINQRTEVVRKRRKNKCEENSTNSNIAEKNVEYSVIVTLERIYVEWITNWEFYCLLSSSH